MSIIKKIVASVATVNIGTPTDLGATPFGNGRNAILRCTSALPITSTLKLQTAPADPDTKAVPVSGSSLWTDLVTLTSASDVAQEVKGLQRFVRYNTTVLDADGPDITLYLEGAK
jgi:hypothetical protein